MNVKDIIFRGKRTDNNQWVFGDLVHRTFWKQDTYSIRIENDALDFYYEEYPIIPNTIGRYTGVLDDNFKRIYEGDIVEYNDGYHYFTGKIKFENGSFGIACDKSIPLEFSNCDNFITLWDICWNSERLDPEPMCNLKVIGDDYGSI